MSGKIPYEKSNNVETSMFSTNGRITLKSFLFRVLICAVIWSMFYSLYYYCDIEYQKCERSEITGTVLDGYKHIELLYLITRNIAFYVVPLVLMIFISLQMIKRIHDTNHSGVFILIPLYNIFLLLKNGTREDNDYGISPRIKKRTPKFNPKY